MGTTRRPPPPCRALYAWLKFHKVNTAALTGTDTKALAAFVHAVELWGYTNQPAALLAMASAVACMQKSTQYIAKKSIPFVLDWSDEARLWPLIEAALSQPPLARNAPPYCTCADSNAFWHQAGCPRRGDAS